MIVKTKNNILINKIGNSVFVKYNDLLIPIFITVEPVVNKKINNVFSKSVVHEKESIDFGFKFTKFIDLNMQMSADLINFNNFISVWKEYCPISCDYENKTLRIDNMIMFPEPDEIVICQVNDTGGPDLIVNGVGGTISYPVPPSKSSTHKTDRIAIRTRSRYERNPLVTNYMHLDSEITEKISREQLVNLHNEFIENTFQNSMEIFEETLEEMWSNNIQRIKESVIEAAKNGKSKLFTILKFDVKFENLRTYEDQEVFNKIRQNGEKILLEKVKNEFPGCSVETRIYNGGPSGLLYSCDIRIYWS